ncbi:hypothetical protein ACTXKY_00470 [Corynebacterium variabile]|uniref:hypothetical protein n=2 Tax=Corynebacterium variabile TaxID=1727 RepID=UPI003FCFF079
MEVHDLQEKATGIAGFHQLVDGHPDPGVGHCRTGACGQLLKSHCGDDGGGTPSRGKFLTTPLTRGYGGEQCVMTPLGGVAAIHLSGILDCATLSGIGSIGSIGSIGVGGEVAGGWRGLP